MLNVLPQFFFFNNHKTRVAALSSNLLLLQCCLTSLLKLRAELTDTVFFASLAVATGFIYTQELPLPFLPHAQMLQCLPANTLCSHKIANKPR